MYQLVIDLKYGCYPVWVCDQSGVLLNNDLPLELSEEQEIDEAFSEIQRIYDDLFEAGGKGYRGFQTEEEKLSFLERIETAISLIRMKMGSFCRIRKKFNAGKL